MRSLLGIYILLLDEGMNSQTFEVTKKYSRTFLEYSNIFLLYKSIFLLFMPETIKGVKSMP